MSALSFFADSALANATSASFCRSISPFGSEDVRAVRAHDRFVSRLAGTIEPRHDRVGVDDDAAEAGEHARDRRLAAGDAAGEADAENHRAPPLRRGHGVASSAWRSSSVRRRPARA